jgi:hypothetical protein
VRRHDEERQTARPEETTGIDRKRFLAGLVGVPAWIAAGCAQGEPADGAAHAGGASGAADAVARTDEALAASKSRDAETIEQRVERILREYDGFGIHRTGTEGDARTARWLAEEARRLGVASELEALPFTRIDVEQAFVEIAGERVEGVPLFDAPFTGPHGVEGEIGPLGDPGAAIEWAKATPDGNGGPELHAHRTSTTQKALVLATGGADWDLPPGLALLNAESYREPFGPPALQVSSESRALLEGVAGSAARVVIDASRTEIEVHNTLARIDGRDPALAPLVVMTPRSGWWSCAAERGGGIAVWLEMMAAIAAVRPARTVHFVASTGHELGHYGLEHYLATRQPLIEAAHAWIHLGANFVTAKRRRVLMQFSDQAMRDLAVAILTRHGAAPDVERPIGERPIGEVRNVAHGARYISILGQSGVFHHPDDRFPGAVDVPRAIACARAFAEIGVALARSAAAAPTA